MASRHIRRGSGRAPLPRRTTRGPLDEDDDPLSLTTSNITSPSKSNLTSPLATPPIAADTPSPMLGASPLLPVRSAETYAQQLEDKDLSFLLDPSIYHPLSQLETAAPFRHAFPPVPSRNTPLSSSLALLDSLLEKCDFLSAAHLSASILGSGTVQPTDVKNVFLLIGIRYSCLELTGNVLLAAQEAKALEDLTSAFYYYDSKTIPDSTKDSVQMKVPQQHIIPFPLRLQALRLQSIGFSDPRRGVSALYEVGLECREHIASAHTSEEDSVDWATRLDEVGIRVVNALIEMGDIDCATRTLESTRPAKPDAASMWVHQMALLFIKVGNLDKAREVIAANYESYGERDTLEPLLAIAEGRYEDAALLWEKQVRDKDDAGVGALIKQNLAVSYLYSGRFQEAKILLEELIDKGSSFQSLTINLATIYELSSDQAKDLKMAMAGKIAKQQQSAGNSGSRSNVDFKL